MRENEYPAVRAEAKAAGTRILFADESAVRSDYHSETSWTPRGQTPTVEKSGQRFSINLISAISPEGELCWIEASGRMNGERFVEFLRVMIHGQQLRTLVHEHLEWMRGAPALIRSFFDEPRVQYAKA